MPVVPMPVGPMPIAPMPMASVVWVCIHDARRGDHDRRWLHDYGTRSDYNRRWWGNDCHWQRQPKPNGNMHPSRMCRERQGKAGNSDAGHNP